MKETSYLRQSLILSLITWVGLGLLMFWLLYNQVELWKLGVLIAVDVLAIIFSLTMLNQSQNELAAVNKLLSSTKRQVQEAQLKIDRYEYDSKKSGELRRIVLNSTKEKDQSLQNMASALDYAMDELLSLSESSGEDVNKQIEARAKSMKQYAFDLKSLARLELKSEVPELHEMNFVEQIELLIESWGTFGKGLDVNVKLDNPEDHMPIMADESWLENLLSRISQALIRMNKDTTMFVHLIGYLDAELGESLRITFTINGRILSNDQLKRILTENTSIVEDGLDIGPGLTFVVARRMAQLLNGHLEVNRIDMGTEVILVIPRNPFQKESED